MRVLWCTLTPGLYDEKNYGTWIASLQSAIMKYRPDIKLGILFEDEKLVKCVKNDVHYFPINKFNSKLIKYYFKINDRINWSLLSPQISNVLNEFEPDIIECFGSEWQYGLIRTITNIPVLIHMQGFRNYIDYAGKAALSNIDIYKCYHFNPIKCLRYRYGLTKEKFRNDIELKIMKINKFYTGRTEWDRDIVSYLSNDGKYFHCEEVIRPAIYNARKKWKYHANKKLRLISISCASIIKGNEIILQTAKILKELGVDFEWRVTGRKDIFSQFEVKTGLRHEDLCIKLLGLIETEMIIDELSSADLYIHPSIIDNSPNSLCEAQLIGTPVLSSFVGGIKHLVDNGKTGFFYPYNEPFSLAFLIMNLIGNIELLKEVSENEIVVSHRRHNPETIANRMHEIYNAIINMD